MKRTVLLALMVLAIILFFALKLDQDLMFEHVKASFLHFQDMYAKHPLFFLSGYFLVYVVVATLSLPGAAVLTLAGGALFGFAAGALAASFASSIGATLSCAASRYIVRDFVTRRFGDRLVKIDEGIRREGSFYLFSLRLIPVIPFFLINLLMGLTSMSLGRFYLVSQLGMLPVTLIYVNAGNQLIHTGSITSVLSFRLLVSLLLLGIFPLVTKKLLDVWRSRRK